jgi:hypothetical protein
VCTAIGIILCVLCRLVGSRVGEELASDDQQKRCSKHVGVEAININKLKVNSASYWSYFTDT